MSVAHDPREPKQPVAVTDALHKLWDTWVPSRPKKDWDAMSNDERALFLRETVNHLDGCALCQAAIPLKNQRVLRARYRSLTGSE